MENKLYKSKNNKIIFGVCGGLGKYLGIDPTIIRIIFILALLFEGVSGLIYLILALIMPTNYNEDIIDVHVTTDNNEKQEDNHQNRNMLVGLIFIVVGAYFLFNIIFPHLIDLNLIISVALIALGFYVIVAGKRGKKDE